MAKTWRFVFAMLAVSCLGMTALAEQVDNPSYTTWAKCKPGTTVTMKQDMDIPGMGDMPTMPNMPNMSGMKIETTRTLKLLEVKPDSLTVEVTTKTQMMGRGREDKTKETILAKIEKGQENVPQGVPTDAKSEVKDMKEGKETLEIKGKKIETVTHEFTVNVAADPTARGGRGAPPSGPAHFKTWNSAEIPGGLVKLEQTSNAEGMEGVKVKMEVTDYNFVK